MLKHRFAFLVVIILSLLLSSCSKTDNNNKSDFIPVQDFHDIPGITHEEISAIEKIQSEHRSFVYGMTKSTEAFIHADTGKTSGFAAFFAEDLTEIFGIEFKVQMFDWDDLLKRFDAAEIDFTSEFTHTPERQSKYIMSNSVADRTLSIFRMSGTDSLEKIKNMRKPKYGFLDGAITYGEIKAIEGETFEPIFAQNETELIKLLQSGKIDAFFDESVVEARFNNVHNITEKNYFPLIFSPVALSTSKEEFAPIITAIDKYIEAGYSSQLVKFYDEGNIDYDRNKFFAQLTDLEKAYIDERISRSESIPMILEADNYPNSFWNKHEGEFQGVAVDILTQIADITGLEFENINTSDGIWADNIVSLEKGEALMISDLSINPFRKGKFVWADEAYSEDSYALVTLEDAPNASLFHVFDSKVGVQDNSALELLYKEWFNNDGNLVTFPGNEDALDALDKGEIDFVLMSRNSLLSLTNILERPGYKANIVLDFTYTTQFGFNAEERILASVVSKAQSVIDTDRISDSWNRKTFNYSRSQLQYIQYFFILLAAVFILLLILFISRIRINRRLEKTVTQRTHELAIQTDLAKGASRAKSDFLSNMSHEIRTPLNAIMGMTEITRRSAGNEEKVLYGTEEIASASSHLLAIINDILDMSKIEAGKFELSEEPFRLLPALDEIYSIMYQKFQDKKIKFITDFEVQDDVCVVGDCLRIKQVLINLLGNASKFTPGGGSVTFSAKEISRSDDIISIEYIVQDTGIGMNEEQIKKLFDAFEQTDKSIATKYGGTGLGLTISKNLVNQMGSDIIVKSKPGEGSSFGFILTFSISEANIEAIIDDAIISDFEGKRILLVEDIEINRIILKELLEETKLIIEEAEDGQEALEKFSNSEDYYYDLIFMDIQMPRMNGYDASKAIRKLNRKDSKRVPIIAMTANAYREDIEKALESGMNGHTSKPIDIQRIIRILADNIRG